MAAGLEHAQAMLDVARAKVAQLLLDYEREHPRVRDAIENVNGWRRMVERLEREEDAA